MVFSYRTLPFSVAGAADLGGAPTTAELALFRDPLLLAWGRAGVNDDATRIVDRARGMPFSRTSRANRPTTVITPGLYGGQKYLSFVDDTNTQELRSEQEILPSTGAYAVAFVGHYKAGVAARYALFGNDAATSSSTWYIGINDSSGRIELKNSNNTIQTTGSGAFVVTAGVPFLAIVGVNPATGQFRTRVNRTHSHGITGITGNIGSARHLQLGTTGGDDFGRANPARGAGMSEWLLFGGDIIDDSVRVANVEAVLGGRYGFPA